MKWFYHLLLAFANGLTNLAEIDAEFSLCLEVDIRELTIDSAHHHFRRGSLTSLDLINCYLRRINYMNPFLNAIIETNPDATKIAQRLDDFYIRTGEFMGPLHGIPILVKDNIGTNDLMNTTAGSYALLGAKTKKNAKVIRKLKKAGAIILGKTNLSEFAGILSSGLNLGWSARGGQTINPYRLNKTPSGSSSGSAVAIAANLGLVSLGTETQGSIINPAYRASLVGCKPSFGLVSMEGVIPVTLKRDSVGVLARTLHDNLLVAALISKAPNRFGMDENYKFHPLKFKYLRVGLIKYPNISSDIGLQMSILEHKLEELAKSGFYFINVTQDIDRLSYHQVVGVMYTEMKYYLNQFLKDKHLSNSPVRSVADIIKFINNSHHYPPNFIPNRMLRVQSTLGLDEPVYRRNWTENNSIARSMVDSLMYKYNLDAFITLSEQSLGSFVLPAMLGYPTLTIPLGIMEDGSPFGATIYSNLGQDHLVYSIAHALDPKTQAREPPKFLIK